ncbi:hypothetical protein HDU80_009651 [Chytriomyces hyalinus]|nr:hypothetical protein HDU80_009651 [Chytriomyces hyalinus]
MNVQAVSSLTGLSEGRKHGALGPTGEWDIQLFISIASMANLASGVSWYLTQEVAVEQQAVLLDPATNQMKAVRLTLPVQFEHRPSGEFIVLTEGDGEGDAMEPLLRSDQESEEEGGKRFKASKTPPPDDRLPRAGGRKIFATVETLELEKQRCGIIEGDHRVSAQIIMRSYIDAIRVFRTLQAFFDNMAHVGAARV